MKKNVFHFVLCSLIRTFVAVMEYTVNCNGRLLSLEAPQVMGILNVTPDSFYADSRKQTEQEIAARAVQIMEEGGSIIDVGACSTRPGSEPVSEAEEADRLRRALTIVRREVPEALVSVDTFRPNIARMVVEDFGAAIINDVGAPANVQHSAGNAQHSMFRMVARLHVPYIYMSRGATMREVLLDCAKVVDCLLSMGQKDIILDPGFGFGKTLEQNYEVMAALEQIQMLKLPILVGISRKSMIFHLLETEAAQTLNGTTALNTIALLKGASILRVHDVREAVECARITKALKGR